MSTPTKLYVITQRPSVYQMVCNELSGEPWVLLQLANAKQLSEVIDDDSAGCVLVDVSDNPVQDLSTIAEIRNNHRSIQVIALGNQWKVSTVVQAIKIGAFEVCEFPNSDAGLINAIRQAIQVERQDGRELHDLIPRIILERLTLGEARILRLLVEGRTTKEVGASLDVSVRTIHYRKKSILQKLGVQNRSEAIELIRITRGSLATF
jgi:DNA-binding NarL/FixJ family response regulator